ncbi:MAG: FkbM family methyltransferase [Planctomycetes bacterium]|nr:FkbM family methyltransferase [Planctomycetota bacterium]
MNPRLIKFVQNTARSLGYEVIPTWRMRKLDLVLHLRKVFDLLKIDTVLDVGANEGQYYDFLRTQVGYTGDIISFEPISAHASALTARAGGDAKWKVHGVALGDAETTLTLNVMKDSDFSSMLKPDDSPTALFRDVNYVVRQEQVRVRRLDGMIGEVLPDWADRNIYLKADTQGYDLQVFEGAGDMLGRVRGLQTEVAVKLIYQGMPDYVTSIATLNRKGFEMTGLFPVSRDKRLCVIEYDCVMVNTRGLSGGVV